MIRRALEAFDSWPFQYQLTGAFVGMFLVALAAVILAEDIAARRRKRAFHTDLFIQRSLKRLRELKRLEEMRTPTQAPDQAPDPRFKQKPELRPDERSWKGRAP